MGNNEAWQKRILVVEDEPSICQVCLRALGGEGFEVDFTGDGAGAQSRLREREYALCLVDLRTPGMNGQQFYQWLNEERPELLDRVIFTTGDLVSGDTKSFLENVGRPVLPKPFTLDELKAVIRDTLKQIGK